jgi:hypothetical protein
LLIYTNAYTYSNTNPYTNAYTYSNTNPYTYSNTYSNTNPYTYSNTYSDSNTYAYPYTYAITSRKLCWSEAIPRLPLPTRCNRMAMLDYDIIIHSR